MTREKLIRWRCYRCGKKLKAPQSFAGKDTRCPRCNDHLVVPGVPEPSHESEPLIEPILEIVNDSPFSPSFNARRFPRPGERPSWLWLPLLLVIIVGVGLLIWKREQENRYEMQIRNGLTIAANDFSRLFRVKLYDWSESFEAHLGALDLTVVAATEHAEPIAAVADRFKSSTRRVLFVINGAKKEISQIHLQYSYSVFLWERELENNTGSKIGLLRPGDVWVVNLKGAKDGPQAEVFLKVAPKRIRDTLLNEINEIRNKTRNY